MGAGRGFRCLARLMERPINPLKLLTAPGGSSGRIRNTSPLRLQVSTMARLIPVPRKRAFLRRLRWSVQAPQTKSWGQHTQAARTTRVRPFSPDGSQNVCGPIRHAGRCHDLSMGDAFNLGQIDHMPVHLVQPPEGIIAPADEHTDTDFRGKLRIRGKKRSRRALWAFGNPLPEESWHGPPQKIHAPPWH